MEFFQEVIKEEDFKPLALKASSHMLDLSEYMEQYGQRKFSKKFYVAIVKESIELEEFLDDHGARNNRSWVYFGEIVASIRNFSRTAYMVSHVLSRIKFYNLSSKDETAFIRDSKKRLEFLHASIKLLFVNLRHEATNHGLEYNPNTVNASDYEDRIVSHVLPQNIYEEEVDDIFTNISRIYAEIKESYTSSQHIMIHKKQPKSKLDLSVIPETINEETLRHIESHVHNAQSMYDTYIQKTPLETERTELTSLRGYISITLHLLGIAREMSHFCERHETSVREEETRKRITKIIQKKNIIDFIINYALYYYTLFIESCQALAQKTAAEFTVACNATVPVPEGLGFHLRPSTLVAKIVNHYGSDVRMVVQDKEFDASSVIDIMWAGGQIKKEGITSIAFSGDKNAVNDIVKLSKANYGEDTMGNASPLPGELSYLRQDEK